jgi:iron(III) transport system permease protein
MSLSQVARLAPLQVRRWRPPDTWTIVLGVGWAVLGLLLLYPLSSVLHASIIDNDTGAFTLDNYAAVLERPRYLRALANTFLGGLGGMLGSLLLGVTLAHLVTRYALRGLGVVTTLAVIALVTPPFIGAYAWIVLFGANGAVRNALSGALGVEVPPLYGAAGVIAVFSLKFFPHVFLLTSAGLRAVNPALEEAGSSLGLSPARCFFKVTLPLVAPSISASALLTFILSIADFGTPRIIGRSFQMLSTEAFILFASELGGNPGMASAISVVLVLISMAFVLLQRWIARRGAQHLAHAGRKRAPGRARTWPGALLVHALAYAIVLAGALPSIVVAYYSFRRTSGPVFQDGFSLQSYARVLHTVPQAIGNSLLFSACAVVGIVVIGTLTGYVVARRRTLATAAYDAALVVPYIIPGVVMGIAFLESFNTGPLQLTGTGAIIVLAILIRRLPYGTRAAIAALGQLSPSLEQAAVSLGYHPARAFLKVTVPLILPGIVAGAMMSFVTAMNELSSSLVLYVGRTMTMPVSIYLLVMDGEYGTASALATMLLAVTGVLVYGAFRLSGRDQRTLL